MNWKAILKIQGLLLVILSVSMLFPIAFSIYYGSSDFIELFSGMAITLVSGIILSVSFNSNKPLKPREGFIIVATGWIIASVFGALPFYFHEAFNGNFIDCVFETMSGLTTTGSSILVDIEILPKGLLFWRSFTHWLGGMGIILLVVAILPILGFNSTNLYKAEVSGPTKDRISPKIKDTAKILWYIYFGMTILLTALLMIGGMDLFNALCHTFGTLGTGGLSTLNKSVGGFNNLYFEVVIIIFMYLSGMNFFLHYSLIKGKFTDIFSNREWRFYTILLIGSTFLISLNIHYYNYSAEILNNNSILLLYKESYGLCLRHSFFQTISLGTCTGYTTTNFDLWPSFSKILLISLMFIGGSAGSTSGGIKQIRIIILIKFVIVEIKRLIYPKAYFSVKVGNQVYQDPVLKNVIAYFIVFLLAFASVTLILTFRGYDIVTSFSASIATLSGVGPGLARVGAIGSFAFFDNFSKLVLIFNMLIGRLEIYSVLILFYTLFYPERLFVKMKR
ncbi:MAG: TrkH family potassium uptake protein [Candidatus Delongbacteria bacterium]|nr:TrkH family potassium uptake protein [Candidatus Delongbacteria bacterium]